MPTIRSGEIQVHGLSELSRALRRLESGFPDELKAANREAADMVATASKGRAASLGGVAAHVAPSIGSRAGATSAGVAFGGAAWPMAGGAEFGAIRYTQFKPWRGNGPGAGYFVYPSIRDNSERITETYTDRVDDLIRRAGL